jgi:hypothetical protein
MEDSIRFKIGDFVIRNIDENINYNPVYEVIALTRLPKLVVGRHKNITSQLITHKFRLASEKEIKEYKLKSIFNKEVKK